jgi:hypothetical protein
MLRTTLSRKVRESDLIDAESLNAVIEADKPGMVLLRYRERTQIDDHTYQVVEHITDEAMDLLCDGLKVKPAIKTRLKAWFEEGTKLPRLPDCFNTVYKRYSVARELRPCVDREALRSIFAYVN